MLLPVRSAKTCGGSHNTQSMDHGTLCTMVLSRRLGGYWRWMQPPPGEDDRGRDTRGHSEQLPRPQPRRPWPVQIRRYLCRYVQIRRQILVCRYVQIRLQILVCRYVDISPTCACDGSETALYTDKHHAAAHELYRDLARMLRITISPVPSVLKIHSSNNLFCSKQLAASLHSSPLQFQRRALVIMVTIYLMIQIYLFNHSRTHVSRKYTRIFRGDTGLLTILNFVETKIGSVPLTSKLLWQKILFVIFEGKFYPHPPQKFILLLIF